jgi:hypothetical protein
MRADQARLIPIHVYLDRAGIKPARTVRQGRELWYKSPLREGDDTPSFKVDTVLNLWFDHGMARGGNVIDLVVELHRVSVKEALSILDSGFAGTRAASRPLADTGSPAGEKEKEQDRSFVVINTRAVEHPALIQYLSTRGMPDALVRRHLTEVRFRPPDKPKQYFAIGFRCGDGFDTRSPVFKGFVGKAKDITTTNFTDRGTVAVFEGPYDFLSWLAMRDLVEPDCGVIILHAVGLRTRALAAITQHGFGRVALYLDRDGAGRETTAYFQRELGGRNVVDRSSLYDGFKDLNEWWGTLGAIGSSNPD